MPRIIWITCVLLLLVTSVSAPALADKRVALVIGNGAYRNVARLDNPANDAKLMADTLREVGFTLVGGGAQLDLDKAGVDRAVQSFGTQLQGADVGLFYYAGHGVMVHGANYLVPVDANPTREADVDFQMLDTTLLLRQMEASGTKLNLVILDACRNNPFGGRGLRASDGGLAQMRAPQGTLISFATQPGNVAADGADGNSPYTKALTTTIRKPGLGIFEAINEVGLAVKRATGNVQEPWFSSSPIDGAFFFVAPAAAPAIAASGTNEAERAWMMIKDTTSAAVLEAFAAQFGNTVYAALARARIDELKNSQVAVAAPPVAPPIVPPVSASPCGGGEATVSPSSPAAKPSSTAEECVSHSIIGNTMVPIFPGEHDETYLFVDRDGSFRGMQGDMKQGGRWTLIGKHFCLDDKECYDLEVAADEVTLTSPRETAKAKILPGNPKNL